MKKQLVPKICLVIVTLFMHGRSWSQQPKKEKRIYNLEQATSDKAQLHTIAFDGLAFMTGNFGADCFFPPGKLADFFGFQYMRDNDENQMGHNTDFLTRIANNVLLILTPEQVQSLTDLAKMQEKDYETFAQKRWVLIKAFRAFMEKDPSVRNKQLNENAVVDFAAALYEIDGKISYERAKVIGKIIRALTANQKKQFDALLFNNSSTWPDKPEHFDKKSLSHRSHVGLMTYASELFSWYKGSLEADIYFCPERHVTYFGGFYMKDFPALDNHGYNISTALTGDAGKAFLETLQPDNRKIVESLTVKQKNALNEIVRLRTEICTLLRQFINTPYNTPDQSRIVSLVKEYGKMDGKMSYWYANAFASVYQTITSSQKAELKKIRNQDVLPEGIYLFSDKISMPDDIDCLILFH